MIRMGKSNFSACSSQVCVCNTAGARPSRTSSFATSRKKPRVFASWRGGRGLPLGGEAQSLERFLCLASWRGGRVLHLGEEAQSLERFVWPLGEEAFSCLLERRRNLWDVFSTSWRGGPRQTARERDERESTFQQAATGTAKCCSQTSRLLESWKGGLDYVFGLLDMR